MFRVKVFLFKTARLISDADTKRVRWLFFGGIFLIFVFITGASLGGVEPVTLLKGIWYLQPINEVYKDSLIAVTGILGVLLGLYFTIITTLVTNAYPHSSKLVIRLITREKKLSAWVILVILTIVGSLFCLVTQGFGFRAPFSFLSLMIAAVFSVVSFVQLGSKSFLLFSPSDLAIYPTNEALNYARLVSAKRGLLWTDSNFQNSFARFALNNMEALQECIVFAKNRADKTKEDFGGLSILLFQLLSIYQSIKRSIPPSSYWFVRIAQHKPWYLTSDFEVQMAQATQTSLPPKQIPDNFWMEKKTKGMFEALLSHSLTFDGLSTSLNIVEYVSASLKNIAYELEVKNAQEWAREITTLVQGKLKSTSKLEIGALVERVSLMGINISLGFFEFVSAIDVPELERRIGSVNWKNPASVYNLNLPTIINTLVEDIDKKTQFEIQVERKKVSPAWYKKELIFRKLSQVLHEGLNEQVSYVSTEHAKLAKAYLTNNNAIAASIICTTGLQHVNKISANVPALKQFAEKLQEGAVVKGLKWPEWNWDKLAQHLKKAEEELLKYLAACILPLASEPDDPDLPDFLGEATMKVGEACFESLRENNKEVFELLFPCYMHGCITCSNRERTRVTEITEQSATRIFIPLLDLLYLSGYANVYSELHLNPDLWKICKTHWDKMLKRNNNAKIIGAATLFHRSSIGIGLRSLQRTQWQMLVEADLSELPSEDDYSAGMFSATKEVIHESPLIRTLASGHRVMESRVHLNHDGLEIFIALYLQQNSITSRMDFGRRKIELLRSLYYRLSREFDVDIKDIRKRILGFLDSPADDD